MKEYNRKKAVAYAKKWAYSRNPAYYNFDPVGGDCTSFVSQCIYAGSKVMNYQKDVGWYYNSGNDKSSSWTGVEFLYKFLINNKGKGPFAIQTEAIEDGDVAQISFDGIKFAHSLLIVKAEKDNLEESQVSTHTFDSYGRKISSYNFKKIRFMHIQGIRN